MVFANIDSIVKRRLLETGLPLHYYLEHLLHAATCLRELNFDTLKIVNTVSLPVNEYYAVDLPFDFVDDVALAIAAGNMLQPIAKNGGITPLRTLDSYGAFTTYNTIPDDNSNNISGYSGSWTWFWNVNDYGEPTGRFFGATGGSQNGYRVDKKRRQIQLTETFTADSVVLMYISDGQSADNATQIDVQAWAAINAFMGWKTSKNAEIKDSYEAKTFYNERRLLRARLDDLTTDDVRAILYRNYKATSKQ